MATNRSDKVTRVVNENDMMCSICLEQFHKPRTLPCLHTFCQECLSDHIIREVTHARNKFDCPICRRATSPLDPSAIPRLWASQFPINNLIVELTQSQQQPQDQFCEKKKKKTVSCDVCKKEGCETHAAIWCNIFGLALCENCKDNVHNFEHEGCYMQEVGDEVLPSFQECPAHQLSKDFYCEDHHSLLCSKCVALYHRQCSSVELAETICKTLRTTSQHDDTNKILDNGLKAVDFLANKFENMIQTLANEKNDVLEKVKNRHSQIVNHFDELKERLEHKVDRIYTGECDKLRERISRCNQLRTDLSNTKKLSVTANALGSSGQTIIAYQQGKRAADSCRRFVDETGRNLVTKRLRYICEDGDFHRQLKGNISLGKIDAIDVKSSLPINENFEVNFNERKAKPVSHVNIKLPFDATDCYASGILYLSETCLVVVDSSNRKVKLFTVSGICLHYLDLEGTPWSVCRHSDDRIAVSMTTDPYISVIRVKSHSLEALYQVNSQRCGDIRGLSYVDGTYWFTDTSSISIAQTSSQKTGWGIFSRNEKTSYSVWKLEPDASLEPVCSFYNHSRYIVYDGKKKDFIISFTSISEQGANISRISPILQQPCTIAKSNILKNTHGIDIDREGNVYACGHDSHNIVQVSTEGDHIRELLTTADGIWYPVDISVFGDKFAVTFNSWDRRNSVYIYSLDYDVC